jgi:ABC-type glycerol-3-phosphate transport system permease component
MSVPAQQLSVGEFDGIIVGTAARVRELATHYLMPGKADFDPRNVGSPEYVRKMANSTAAVEVVCSLVNTFGVMAGYNNYIPQMAIADLVFILNTNTFWVQNAAYLVPLMNTAVNAFNDAQELKTKNEPLWKELVYHNNNCWLELLPAVVFCLKGYAEMRRVSVEMKQAFEPLLRSA